MSERLPDNPEGFARFYELLFARPLPRHARDEWIEPLYAARAEGKGLVVEAFRGSSKSTTLTVAFTAFRLGQEPHKSALLVQANDQAARGTSQHIANLIAHNAGWLSAFDRIRPDRDVSWSARGYELLHDEMDYAQWRALCAAGKGKDPSLLGLGYRSSAIIGKHPTGLLVVDDIHDEGNTRSARELERVLATVTGTIMPTVMPDAWVIFVGTPWTANDTLATMKATGRFISAHTPVYRSVARSGGSEGYWQDKALTWPEVFPIAQIEKARQLSGEKQFTRMYLLDLAAMEGMHLKAEWLAPFAYERIDPQWPVLMGVDYASSSAHQKNGRRDYFAVAIGRAIPHGGIVLVDGFRAQVTQGEALAKVQALAAQYNPQIVAVESVGKGEEFYNLLLTESKALVVPVHTGRQSKAERFEHGMAPMFHFGRALVSDVETAFLRAFRDEWLRWPQGEHDDTLDAVYWMLNSATHQLYTTPSRVKRKNPFSEFANA